jgi:hypothetical protein
LISKFFKETLRLVQFERDMILHCMLSGQFWQAIFKVFKNCLKELSKEKKKGIESGIKRLALL